jgi:hypothetical protein
MDGVKRMLDRDFQRGLALLDAALRRVQRGDGDGAAPSLAQLCSHLRRRIELEEEQLFVALEFALHDLAFAPTACLRREHEAILCLLAIVESDFERRDWAAADGDLRELRAALRTHDGEERRTIHPLLGHLPLRLAPAELEAALEARTG